VPKPQLRKTKIVATIGPQSDAPEVLRAMLEAGLNVARLNLSHGSFPEHKQRLERIRTAAEQVGANVAIMIDTRGIEIRTGRLRESPVELAPEAEFTLFTDSREGDAEGVSISYRRLPEEVAVGAPILLDDGAIELSVEAVEAGRVRCRVVHSGLLGENKSVNLPQTQLSMASQSPENRADVIREMNFAAENDVDYIAASFVQQAADVELMREILGRHEVEIPIIAKIENRAGIANLVEIAQSADGVMVARGDLGVELPLAEVPGAQKKIIRTTVMQGKPVITATQMLASMEVNPKPTRAEASDVANAILDGTSAVMLSGETAVGRYPVEAVRIMAELAVRAESHLAEFGYLQKILPHPSNVVTEAVSDSAARMAKQLNAALIVSLTSTGFTSRLISKHRPACPIMAITPSSAVARRLAMNWGVLPLLYEGEHSDEAKIDHALRRARELGYVGGGDIVVATAGVRQQAGGTDLIRVITLGA
jgi:pyruvate kinase